MFRGVAAGEQLGNLEYLVDDPVVFHYRRLVGESSCYANLLADDCESMAAKRFPEDALRVIWRRFDFLRPPIIGRRIQVGGWLKDVAEVRGQPWLRVSAFAVDEIGTEILRSEAAFVVGRASHDGGGAERVVVSQGSGCAGGEFGGRVGDSTRLERWIVPAVDCSSRNLSLRNELTGDREHTENNWSAQLFAGWLEGEVGRIFGDDFWWGGRLALAYRAPIEPGDFVTADVAVIERDEDQSGTSTVRLTLNARNQRHEPVAAGTVSLNIPSPRLL